MRGGWLQASAGARLRPGRLIPCPRSAPPATSTVNLTNRATHAPPSTRSSPGNPHHTPTGSQRMDTRRNRRSRHEPVLDAWTAPPDRSRTGSGRAPPLGPGGGVSKEPDRTGALGLAGRDVPGPGRPRPAPGRLSPLRAAEDPPRFRSDPEVERMEAPGAAAYLGWRQRRRRRGTHGRARARHSRRPRARRRPDVRGARRPPGRDEPDGAHPPRALTANQIESAWDVAGKGASTVDVVPAGSPAAPLASRTSRWRSTPRSTAPPTTPSLSTSTTRRTSPSSPGRA